MWHVIGVYTDRGPKDCPVRIVHSGTFESCTSRLRVLMGGRNIPSSMDLWKGVGVMSPAGYKWHLVQDMTPEPGETTLAVAVNGPTLVHRYIVKDQKKFTDTLGNTVPLLKFCYVEVPALLADSRLSGVQELPQSTHKYGVIEVPVKLSDPERWGLKEA